LKIAGQSFIEDIRKIAKNTHPVMVKTDKTSEYRQLRARGETSEKARSHTPERDPPHCRARVMGFYFLDRTRVERRKAWAEAGGELAGSEKKFTNDLIDRG
jgi:hypothetical protein